MIKIFIPVPKGRDKTSIRGFWYSKDTKRTYYDYFRIEEHFQMPSHRYIDGLRTKYNQEAIAIIDYGTLKIFYKDKKTEILSTKISGEVQRNNLRTEIKRAIQEHGGITIYQSGNKYFKEIYINEDISL